VTRGIHVIQGGGLTPALERKKTEAPIKNEWDNGLKHDAGTIAMARMSAPDSATSQFYINVRPNYQLDQPRSGAAYCVFGRVVDGMNVVESIYDAETTVRQGRRDVPIETITIEKAERIEREQPPKQVTPESSQ
jgi:peptidyl-prolyl cis-trans isomerase A (cyclophilin A)